MKLLSLLALLALVALTHAVGVEDGVRIRKLWNVYTYASTRCAVQTVQYEPHTQFWLFNQTVVCTSSCR